MRRLVINGRDNVMRFELDAGELVVEMFGDVWNANHATLTLEAEEVRQLREFLRDEKPASPRKRKEPRR